MRVRARGDLLSETGWLIERQLGGRAIWWRATPTCGRTWTTDANEAVRFARKEDAQKVMFTWSDPFFRGAIATEHMWCMP